jgi:hypothetical protein
MGGATRVILPVAGAAAGAMLGGPAGAMAGYSIGSGVGGALGGREDESSGGALGSVTPSQSPGIPPLPGFATNPTTGATTLGSSPLGGFAHNDVKSQAPGNPQKAKEMQDALMGVGSMSQGNRAIQSQEDLMELERLKAQAYAQNAAYRPPPSPSFAPAVGGQIPQMGGGFAYGR